MKERRRCELCQGSAAVYCEADAAFLCWPCDARVHGANFLVARHLRRIACAECHALDDGRLLAGAGSTPVHSLCRSCRRHPPEETTSSDSSSCVSSVDEDSAARRGAQEEGILVNWARRMGLRDQGSQRCAAAVMAMRVLRACSGKMTATPLRVGLAAALWFAVKRRGTCEGARLRALEACSGVPAKLIVVAESRLARAARRSRDGEKQDRWAKRC